MLGILQGFHVRGIFFISPGDGSEDVFVHVSDSRCIESWQCGVKMTFDLEADHRSGKHKGVNINWQDEEGFWCSEEGWWNEDGACHEYEEDV